MYVCVCFLYYYCKLGGPHGQHSYPNLNHRRGGGRRLPPTPSKPSTLQLKPTNINFPKLNASPTHVSKWISITKFILFVVFLIVIILSRMWNKIQTDILNRHPTQFMTSSIIVGSNFCDIKYIHFPLIIQALWNHLW